VLLYPLYHPAAALYTPSMLRALEEDFARIPALLGHAARAPVSWPGPPVAGAPTEPLVEPAGSRDTVQLGLF